MLQAIVFFGAGWLAHQHRNAIRKFVGEVWDDLMKDDDDKQKKDET